MGNKIASHETTSSSVDDDKVDVLTFDVVLESFVRLAKQILLVQLDKVETVDKQMLEFQTAYKGTVADQKSAVTEQEAKSRDEMLKAVHSIYDSEFVAVSSDEELYIKSLQVYSPAPSDIRRYSWTFGNACLAVYSGNGRDICKKFFDAGPQKCSNDVLLTS